MAMNQVQFQPGMAAYSASKAAIDYFTLTLAEELRESNIAVNCIAPTGGIYSEGSDFRDCSKEN